MAKTRFKQVLIIFILIVMSVCFCACGQVNSSIISNADGGVEEIVSVELDVNEVLQAGYLDIQSLKDEISLDAKTEAVKMKEYLNNKIQLHLLQVESEEDKKTLNSYIDGISVYESKWKDNVYTIRVVFENMDIYKYYYNISDDNKVEMKEEEHFFYNKVYWYGNTMYLKHRDLFESLKDKYETKYPNLINHTDTELTYTYCADLRRQHSDADFIEKIDGKYYHTWIVDKDNPNQQIMFYYNVANTYNWIVVSLLITLSLTIIFSIVAIIIQLNNKKQKNINN